MCCLVSHRQRYELFAFRHTQNQWRLWKVVRESRAGSFDVTRVEGEYFDARRRGRDYELVRAATRSDKRSKLDSGD